MSEGFDKTVGIVSVSKKIRKAHITRIPPVRSGVFIKFIKSSAVNTLCSINASFPGPEIRMLKK